MRYVLLVFTFWILVGWLLAARAADCSTGCFVPGQWCNVHVGCPGDCVCVSRTFGGEGVCVAVR